MPRLIVSFIGLFLLAASAQSAPRDLMLIVEDGIATVSAQPLAAALEDFIAAQPDDARVGVVAFAEVPRLLRALQPADDGLRASLQSLQQQGGRAEIAGAVERAMYELRLKGREDAARVIVLLSNGVIDTGNAERDGERTRWLRDMLAADAAEANIRIFAVAFSDAADFQLLQGVVRTADGEYFRASSAEELADALARIDAALARSTAPAARPERLVFDEPVSVAPLHAASNEDSERTGPGWRLLLVVLAMAVLGIVAVMILWGEEFAALVQRRVTHGRRRLEEAGPKAVLYDVSDTSNIRRYEIGSRPVVIGRVAGSDTAMDYVVVDERTVGRWHATIERRGQSFWIRDEGSVNGTFVNNQRVTAEHPLKHGDMLRVHRHEFEFVIPELFDSDRTVVSTDVRMAREA